jgi:hypothetical protein
LVIQSTYCGASIVLSMILFHQSALEILKMSLDYLQGIYNQVDSNHIKPLVS